MSEESIEKKLARRMLSKDEGIQPGVGTPYQQPLRDDERVGRYAEYRDQDTGAVTSIPSPGPAPGPTPAAVGAIPAPSGNPAVRMSEEMARKREEMARMSEENGFDEMVGSTYSPETQDSGTNRNAPARRASALRAEEGEEGEEEATQRFREAYRERARKEEDERADEAFKALSGLFGAIVSKYTDPTNPTATVYMRKEFDDAIKQVFTPSAGSTRFTNTRSPGQGPAKIAIEPGRSGPNVSNPDPASYGDHPTKTPPAQYDASYPQAYRNPRSPGSGYQGETTTDGTENYGNRTIGSGISGKFPQPKPSRNPNIRASNPYHSQRGGEAPSHPSTENTVPSGTYSRDTYITSQAAQVGDFSKSENPQPMFRDGTSRTTYGHSRHGPGAWNEPISKEKIMHDSVGNRVEDSGVGTNPYETSEFTKALRSQENRVVAEDNPARGIEPDALTVENIDSLIEKSRGNKEATEILEKHIVIQLGKKLKLTPPKE